LIKIKEKISNLYFAEIPPKTEELNFANYFLTNIKDKVANDMDKTTEDRYESLEMLLSSYYNVPMYN
jgi:hypothetical protein